MKNAYRALAVITKTLAIRAFLEANDPKALQQCEAALAPAWPTPKAQEQAWIRAEGGEAELFTLTKLDPTDAARPEGLSPRGNKAYEIICRFLEAHDLAFTGGCRLFYSPAEWRERGESYCGNSELVIVYDGAEAKYALSLDGLRYDIHELLRSELGDVDLFTEEGTHWYSGVYPVRQASV